MSNDHAKDILKRNIFMKNLSLIMLLICSFSYTPSVFAQCIEIGG